MYKDPEAGDLSSASLIIVGHGSTVNPDSSTPTSWCVEEIRKRGIFREVVACFWKEEPSMRDVWHMLEGDQVFVVPHFISEGYFTQKVIPRELGLAGAVTVKDGRRIRYCEPVGSHPRMTDVLLHRAREVAPGVDPTRTGLIIAGHGTDLNENSARAAKHQVKKIQEMNIYAEVKAAYMEEAPRLDDWDQLSASPNVVVVPFFISDGLHSYQDIPVLLGMDREAGPAASRADVFRRNPYLLRGRRLYLSGAIGSDPLMVEVVLDQVTSFSE